MDGFFSGQQHFEMLSYCQVVQGRRPRELEKDNHPCVLNPIWDNHPRSPLKEPGNGGVRLVDGVWAMGVFCDG